MFSLYKMLTYSSLMKNVIINILCDAVQALVAIIKWLSGQKLIGFFLPSYAMCIKYYKRKTV